MPVRTRWSRRGRELTLLPEGPGDRCCEAGWHFRARLDARCATANAVIELAGTNGIACVAEYVESQAILNLLCELGIDYAQGYAIHRPEPLRAVRKTLRLDAGMRRRRADSPRPLTL